MATNTNAIASGPNKQVAPPVPTKSIKKIFKSKAEKEAAEAEALISEGLHAMKVGERSEGFKIRSDNYIMDIGDERHTVTPVALKEKSIQNMIEVLLNWINDVVGDRRIVINDIVEDLYNGQVLSEFVEILFNIESPFSTKIAQSYITQKSKLNWSLEEIHKRLGIDPTSVQWSFEEIHGKNPLSIIHLLVTLAKYFDVSQNLPKNVSIQVSVVKMTESGTFQYTTTREEITSHDLQPISHGPTKDVFDQLFDQRNEKVQIVKKSLIVFVNKHLQKLNITVNDLDTEFCSGVYFLYLISLLEGYFIPFGEYHENPLDYDQKLENVLLAFKLIQEVGIELKKTRPEEIVRGDVKSILRVLYAVFSKYKNL